MMICPNCHARVGAPYKYCPLCQNELYEEFPEEEEVLTEEVREDAQEPEETEPKKSAPYYPRVKHLRILSLVDKIQMFVAAAACIISLALDFMFGIHGEVHWSYLVCMWCFIAELIIKPSLTARIKPSSFMTYWTILISIGLLINGWYLDFLPVLVNYTLPILLLSVITANAILSIIFRKGESLVYVVCNALIGIIPPVVLKLVYGDIPLMWEICLLESVVSIVGFLIFFGGRIYTEFHRRLNL